MNDSAAWTISLGCWRGIHVRLHALFLLFALLTLYVAHLADLLSVAVMGLGILLVSVLLHELGHCYTARRVGGFPEEVVIGPLGGLAQVNVPHERHAELYTALAGPAVNLVICLAAVPCLLLFENSHVWGLLNPLQPANLVGGADQVLKLTFWINWNLVLLNMLPAYPFDGGRALRAVLWPVFGHPTVVHVVARVATATAIVLVLIGVCIEAHLDSAYFPSYLPPWFPLTLIAVILYFSARQEVVNLRRRQYSQDVVGFDLGQGFTALEDDFEPEQEPGFFARWLERRRDERERQAREQEAFEDRRVDEILARLHGQGYESLSAEERAILQRASARYRNRQQQ